MLETCPRRAGPYGPTMLFRCAGQCQNRASSVFRCESTAWSPCRRPNVPDVGWQLDPGERTLNWLVRGPSKNIPARHERFHYSDKPDYRTKTGLSPAPCVGCTHIWDGAGCAAAAVATNPRTRLIGSGNLPLARAV